MVVWKVDPQSSEPLFQQIVNRVKQAVAVGRLKPGLTEADDWPSDLSGARHHMGTTRMHPDPKRGVVDTNGRVHGTANLFVAGSSVFPTSGSANPTLTILALANCSWRF